jgi:hypothetical protein
MGTGADVGRGRISSSALTITYREPGPANPIDTHVALPSWRFEYRAVGDAHNVRSAFDERRSGRQADVRPIRNVAPRLLGRVREATTLTPLWAFP